MSTRCQTIVYNYTRKDDEPHEVLRMYRHTDGYPETGGQGADIAQAMQTANYTCKQVEAGLGLEGYFNLEQTWLCAFMGALLDTTVPYLSVKDLGTWPKGTLRSEFETQGSEHGDLSYVYEIFPPHDNKDAQAIIRRGYKTEPMFSGDAKALTRFVMASENDATTGLARATTLTH